MHIIHRAALALTAVGLLVLPLERAVRAQASPAVIIDKMFRSDYAAPGMNRSDRDTLVSYKSWMGTYQRTISKDENSFVAIFDSGSLPIEVKLSDLGRIERITFGCPNTKSLSVNNPPSNLQNELRKCGGFRRQEN